MPRGEKKPKKVELSTEQQKRYELICRNLPEIIGDDKLRELIATCDSEHGRHLKVYWGTATTGKPHVAYYVPMTKVADYLRAGCEVSILFADLHAYLDNMKSSWTLLQKRVKYYENIIKTLLESAGVPIEKLRFIRGTDYQLTRKYSSDVVRLTASVTVRDAHRAGAEVVKQVASPMLSGLLYPLLQALDEEYLGVDVQFGGVDQRKIFILAEEQLPKLGMVKRVHLMNEMVPGLTGTKMSSSEEHSKIDCLDSATAVEAKIRGAELSTAPETLEANGILGFVRHVVLPLLHGQPFVISSESGVDVDYTDFSLLKSDFAAGRFAPDQLKDSLIKFVNSFLQPIREKFSSPEMLQLIAEAYPKSIVPDAQCQKCETLQASDLKSTQLSDSVKELNGFLTKCILDDSVMMSGANCLHRRLLVEKQCPRVLFCVANKVHIGMMVPLFTLVQLAKLGCEIVILLADLHAYVDNQKCPFELFDQRSALTKAILISLLQCLDAPMHKITFKQGSTFQLEENFMLDVYKLSSNVELNDAKLACENSVTQLEHPTLASYTQPLFQAIAEQYCDADIHLGGADQATTFAFAEEALPKIGYRARAHVTVKLVPGVDGSLKMSSSVPESIIEPTDSAKQVKNKLKKMFCEPENVDNNPCLDVAREIVFPFLGGKAMVIPRKPENGGEISFATFADLFKAFSEGLHPGDLKLGLETFFATLLEPVRKAFTEEQVNKDLIAAAYPPPAKKKGGANKAGTKQQR